MRKPNHHSGLPIAIELFLRGTVLAALLSLAGCATMRINSMGSGTESNAEYIERSKALFTEGNYEAALKENQKALAEKKVALDVALFNMGLISAYSSNPQKDYPKALVSFRTLVSQYPQSPLAEQAKVWVLVLEEHQKITEDKQKLVEEKRALTRERELLSLEREKLKYTAEKLRQVDIEIEKRRRQTLSK
jgi:hypothetical protein